MRRIALVGLLLSLSACDPSASGEAVVNGTAGQVEPARSAAEPGAHRAVVASVQAVLDAINSGNPDLLLSVMRPDARIVATGRGPASSSTVDEMAGRLAGPDQGFVERMWSPQVAIDGPIASVWAPYDFYRGGEFSHCGVDAFHLIETDGEWLVQDLIYSVRQPPACGMHPDGPPR